MIDEYQPKINVDELMQKIQEEVSKKKDLAAEYNRPKELIIAKNKLILGQVRKFLKVAENRSVIRKKWPEKLTRFPLNISLLIKPFVLKALSALFKDQREINQNLIGALKLSLIVNEQLLQEIDSLRGEIEEIQKTK